MKSKVVKNIFLSFGLVILVAVLGSVFVNLGMEWYEQTIKPNQWIPNFIIPLVWTTIYLLYSISIYIWLSKQQVNKELTILLIINGVFNILWCLIFFTLQQKFIGLIAIILNLFFAIYLSVIIGKNKLKPFNILLIYPTWVAIATTLNLAVWILN